MAIGTFKPSEMQVQGDWAILQLARQVRPPYDAP